MKEQGGLPLGSWGPGYRTASHPLSPGLDSGSNNGWFEQEPDMEEARWGRVTAWKCVGMGGGAAKKA